MQHGTHCDRPSLNNNVQCKLCQYCGQFCQLSDVRITQIQLHRIIRIAECFSLNYIHYVIAFITICQKGFGSGI